MVGRFAACCARAANGHAAAAPPSSVMNSRRFTAQCLRASERQDSTPQLRRRLLRCRISIQLMSQMGHSRRSDGQQGFAECLLCLQ
jgi:hypothetical protein